jgi:hypothetical protein
MNTMRFLLCMLFVITISHVAARPTDIYLVIYTTHDGRTGHVGLAVDNYKILVRDTVINRVKTTYNDTVRTVSLTYFDLWGPAEIRWDEHADNLASRYFTLPRSSAEPRITADYFLTRGLPHSYEYPCDALLRLHTSPTMDAHLKEIVAGIQEERPYFNSREYNCTDFVLLCLNRLLHTSLEAKEYIPFTWSSTPNEFYKIIVAHLPVQIIKQAGDEIGKSFVQERLLNSVLYNQSTHHEKTND